MEKNLEASSAQVEFNFLARYILTSCVLTYVEILAVSNHVQDGTCEGKVREQVVVLNLGSSSLENGGSLDTLETDQLRLEARLMSGCT